MSALEEIQAAIDTLTAIKGDAGLVVQCVDPRDVCFRTDDDTDDDGDFFWFGVIVEMDDAELAEGIVTLHRTIDAQLVILTNALLKGDGFDPAQEWAGWQYDVAALARAINGKDRK